MFKGFEGGDYREQRLAGSSNESKKQKYTN